MANTCFVTISITPQEKSSVGALGEHFSRLLQRSKDAGHGADLGMADKYLFEGHINVLDDQITISGDVRWCLGDEAAIELLYHVAPYMPESVTIAEEGGDWATRYSYHKDAGIIRETLPPSSDYWDNSEVNDFSPWDAPESAFKTSAIQMPVVLKNLLSW